MTGERKRGPKGKEAAEEPRLASFEDIMKELDAEFPIEGPAARPAPKARPASEEGAPAAAEGEDLPPLVDAHADVRSGAPTAAGSVVRLMRSNRIATSGPK